MMLIKKSSFEKEGISMVKTVLKIDGMSCSMCEAHMNEVIRNNFKVNKVSSSASAGETVIISDAELDIPLAHIPDFVYHILIKFRLMADQQDTSTILLQCSL